MTYTFEDYQIVLSQSIHPNRIIKIIPQGDEFGRVKRIKKRYDIWKHVFFLNIDIAIFKWKNNKNEF